MFKAIKEIDEFNQEQTHYYLTQGDSCKITSTPKIDGVVVPISKIEKCVFKIANLSRKLVKEIQLQPNDESNFYVLSITSDISEALLPTQYVYEIEYTMEKNNPNDESEKAEIHTTNAWKFDILKQITAE